MSDNSREKLYDRVIFLRQEKERAQGYYDYVKRKPDTFDNAEELDNASSKLDRVWEELKEAEAELSKPPSPQHLH
jgi:hypothetical protein